MPETVKIKTESSDITSAPVTWDFKNVKYDPNKDDEQKFEVSGEITLPDTVVNKNNIPLNVKVNVTVSAAKEIKYSATGYEGNYDGQTHGIYVKVTEPADTEIWYSTNQVTGSKKINYTKMLEHIRFTITSIKKDINRLAVSAM